jgi:hypothetical protein
MNFIPKPKSRWASIFLLFLFIALGIWVVWKFAPKINLGNGDFIGYWSAVYQIRRGHNPYDPKEMMNVQQTAANSGLDFAVMTWNLPTLFVFLLPLAWLSFTAARSAWLVINVIILLAASLMLARLYLPPGGKPLLGFYLLVLFFPQVILTLVMGQVTLLVLLGLASSMILIKKGHWFWAGAALILTSVKPQIAFLAAPYLLILMVYRRKWQGWLGMLAAGGACMGALFVFRPNWVADTWGLTSMVPNNWATPTIGGLLSYWRVTDAARYLIVVFLPLAWVLARPQSAIRMESAVALLTVITVPTSFFGWGYDQSILLIPIVQLFGWILLASNRLVKIMGMLAILGCFLFIWIQRVARVNEIYYFWVPVIIGIVYGIGFAVQKTALSRGAVVAHAE